MTWIDALPRTTFILYVLSFPLISNTVNHCLLVYVFLPSFSLSGWAGFSILKLFIIFICYHKCKCSLCDRKRLDATVQDLEEKQNSKKDTVCNFSFLIFTFRLWLYMFFVIPFDI